MNYSSLEITENEYCIKLQKGAFDLAIIRQVINRLQSEQSFNRKTRICDEDDIISRGHDLRDECSFDRLSDK